MSKFLLIASVFATSLSSYALDMKKMVLYGNIEKMRSSGFTCVDSEHGKVINSGKELTTYKTKCTNGDDIKVAVITMHYQEGSKCGPSLVKCEETGVKQICSGL